MNKEVDQAPALTGGQSLPAAVTQGGNTACIHFGGHGHNGDAWMSAKWVARADGAMTHAFGPCPVFGFKMRPRMMHPMPFI